MVGSALKLCDLVLSNAWQSCIKSNDDKEADLDNADEASSSGEPGRVMDSVTLAKTNK